MSDQINTQVTRLSLAEAKLHEVRQKLHGELLPAIQAVERELAQIDSTTKANWRDTATNPANVERLKEDRERLQNRRAILTDARERAEQDLRDAVAAVEVDALSEIRAAVEVLGESRTQDARDLVAIAEMAAAKVNEMERKREVMIQHVQKAQRYFLGRANGTEEMRRSEEWSELLRLLKATEVQPGFDHVLGMNTPAHVWSYEFRRSSGVTPDAVRNVGGQCKGTLITLDRAMQRLIADARAKGA